MSPSFKKALFLVHALLVIVIFSVFFLPIRAHYIRKSGGKHLFELSRNTLQPNLALVTRDNNQKAGAWHRVFWPQAVKPGKHWV